MTQIRLALLALVAIVAAVQARAFEVEGIEYELKPDRTVEVVEHWPAYSGDVTIPPSVTLGGRSYAVTSIGRSAFAEALDLTSVSLPPSLKSIGNDAFRGCVGITSLAVPNGVTTLGSRAFADCTSLQTVSLGESITEIPYGLCMNCYSLTQATVPDQVTTIGAYAFASSGIKTVTIGKNVTEIAPYAFEECKSLNLLNLRDLATWCTIDFFEIEHNPLYHARQLAVNGVTVNRLVVPEGVTELKPFTFANSRFTEIELPASLRTYHVLCLQQSRVVSLTIPDGVTEIKVSPTTDLRMSSLSSLTIGKGVKVIPSSAFCNLTNLTRLVLSMGLEEIGASAFSRVFITEVVIPNSVRRLDSPFMQCLKLKSITLGRNVREIDGNLCRGDSALRSIKVLATDPSQMAFVGEGYFGELIDVNKGPYGPNKSLITLTVPKGCVERYRQAPVWREFGQIVEDTSVILGDADGNGLVEIDDMNILINLMLKKADMSDYDSAAVDIDGNGYVDIDDVNYVINVILRKV